MAKVSSRVTSSVLMRIDHSEKIQTMYKEGFVEFGCPANWLDYAMKCKDETIGDYFECVFAHTLKSDKRINEMKDIHGNPMGDHLLILENSNSYDCLLRFVPTILIPTMCFYSFSVKRDLAIINKGENQYNGYIFDLDKYREYIGYAEDDSSFLFITDVEAFFKELIISIPKAIEDNKNNLTSKRYYGGFKVENPLFFRDVDYNKHKKSDLFFDNPNGFDSIFWKLPEYQEQSEMRLIIPNINFLQTYNPDIPYDHKRNKLVVQTPQIREYAKIVKAKEAHYLFFKDNDDLERTFDFGFLELMKENVSGNNDTLV